VSKHLPRIYLLAGLLLAFGARACDLKIEHGWIREPPPAATVLGGYAVLVNHGSKSITVTAVKSAAFEHVEMHETHEANGMAQMRPLPSVSIAAGAQVEFAPNGRHFMLMGPSRSLHRGDRVELSFTDAAGCTTRAAFVVGPGADMDMDMHQH
jgi:copper(I)-binding protein